MSEIASDDEFEVFGKTYHWKQIDHTAHAFIDTAIALESVLIEAKRLQSLHASEKTIEREQGERGHRRVIRHFRRKDRFVGRVIQPIPDVERFKDRMPSVIRAIESSRGALYVAEHGPLWDPYRVIQDSAKTVFDRVAKLVDDIISPILAAVPKEWTDGFGKAWDSLKPRCRWAKMSPIYLAALQSRWIIDDGSIAMKVSEMWDHALIGNRLIETLGRENSYLLDGAFHIAELGYLACSTPGYPRKINDSYPLADTFPLEFQDVETCKRYAEVLLKLRDDIAPKMDDMDFRVTDALSAAAHYATASHENATGHSSDEQFRHAASHFDPVLFGQAYIRIRHGIASKLKQLIPDRQQMWNEWRAPKRLPSPVPAPTLPVDSEAIPSLAHPLVVGDMAGMTYTIIPASVLTGPPIPPVMHLMLPQDFLPPVDPQKDAIPETPPLDNPASPAPVEPHADKALPRDTTKKQASLFQRGNLAKGRWLTPATTLKNIADSIDQSEEQAKVMLAAGGLWQYSRQRWTVCLDQFGDGRPFTESQRVALMGKLKRK